MARRPCPRPLPAPFHPDEFVLAQPRRALFRELTTKRLRRGVFRSVPDLVAVIYAYIALNNADPRPFVWTASAEAILAKVGRCRAILETAH